MEEYREFLDFFNAHVDPNDQLPVKVPGYNLTDSEIAAEVINWTQQYLLQMKCPQALLVPIVNEVLLETRNSCQKNPKQCGFDAYSYNPLKLSTVVISHTNIICNRLLDNAELNEMLLKSSTSVLAHTPHHYVKAIKNTRRKMEDRHICISDFNGMFAVKGNEPTSFYGVFDGHGGQDAAIFTSAQLCYNIANSAAYPNNIDKAIRDAFKKTDEAFIIKSDKHAIYSGTTAIVCIYRAIEKRLSVGWVGDSQALLACEGKVCQIVSPHVPSLQSERDRIEDMGGVILNWDGSCRVNGQLAVSRAIGDAMHKPFVTSEPDTSTVSLDGAEDFLIIASDGLWEALSEDEIALFVYREISNNPDCAHSAVDRLVESARKRTSDNITVIVVFFKEPHLIAKSTWLNKMEPAYDSNDTNNASENESSHFKFDSQGECKIPPNIHKNDAIKELQIISPCEMIERNFDDTQIKDNFAEARTVTDPGDQFDDDFGPETDVDTIDDAAFTKNSTIIAEDASTDSIVSNGFKQTELENKIIQHLSEQHKDFLTNTNPFDNKQYLETTNEQLLDPSISQEKENYTEVLVDNKIIDALEKLKCENEDEIGDECFDDNTSKSSEIQDVTEKTDISHEKQTTEQKTEECIDHYDTNVCSIDSGASQLETAHISVPNENKTCVVASAGEDSEEEEDEWNYYKGDKNQPQQQLLIDTVESTNVIVPGDVPQDIGNEEKPLASSTKGEDEIIPDYQDTLHLNSIRENSPTVHFQEETEATSEKELLQSDGNQVSSPSPSPRSVSRSSTCREVNPEAEIDLLESEIPCEQYTTIENLEGKELETNIEQTSLERPDSLGFEMASKLNPEAKEFVPTGSPTRSNPASPVSDEPKPLHNSYLLINDDTVIAQSPKKSSITMDNIDVPAEDDFKHGIDNRPHELEQLSEFTNGNENGNIINLHSPVSEQSYQDLNFKEAMQSDEKLDNEYNDGQLALRDDASSEFLDDKNIVNLPTKDNNTMNMSFYEGRDETSLTTNSDELNKVQLLPDVEEPVEQPTEPDTLSMDNKIEQAPIVEELQRVAPEETSVPENLTEDHPTSSIFEVASKVVDDVATLVDQMQLGTPVTSDALVVLDEPVQKEQIEKIDNLLSNDHQPQIVEQSGKDETLSNDDAQTQLDAPAIIAIPVALDLVEQELIINKDHFAPNGEAPPSDLNEVTEPNEIKTYEAVPSVVEESLQQEIVGENEFITDESVLNVPSPSQDAFIEMKDLPEQKTCEVASRSNENETEKFLAPSTSENLLKLDFVHDEPLEQKELQPVVDVKPVSTPELMPVAIVSSKPTTAKNKSISGPAQKASVTSITGQKTNAVGKALTKLPAKPNTTTTKTAPSVTTVNRTSSTTKVTSTSKTPPVATSRMSITNKPTAERKAVPPVKKVSPTASAETTTRTTAAVRNSLANPPIKTTTTKSTPVNGSHHVNNSTVTRTTTTKTGPVKAPITRTIKTSSATTHNSTTSTSTLSAKPRTIASKPTSTVQATASTTTSSTTTTSKTNLVSSAPAKRTTTRVQSATQRTTSSATTTTLGVKSSSTASSTLTATKPTSASVASAGLRKSGTTTNKKSTSISSVPKTAKLSSTGKIASSKKTTSLPNHKEATAPLGDDTKNMLDLDKQQKNDNNELITKSGIETQMIVIDSAAD